VAAGVVAGLRGLFTGGRCVSSVRTAALALIIKILERSGILLQNEAKLLRAEFQGTVQSTKENWLLPLKGPERLPCCHTPRRW